MRKCTTYTINFIANQAQYGNSTYFLFLRMPLTVAMATSCGVIHVRLAIAFKLHTFKIEIGKFKCRICINYSYWGNLPIAWFEFLNQFLSCADEWWKNRCHIQMQLVGSYKLVEFIHETANAKSCGRIANVVCARFEGHQRCNRYNVTASIGHHFWHKYTNHLQLWSQLNTIIISILIKSQFTQNCDNKLTFSTRIMSPGLPSNSDIFVNRPALFTIILTLPKSKRIFSRSVPTSS